MTCMHVLLNHQPHTRTESSCMLWNAVRLCKKHNEGNQLNSCITLTLLACAIQLLLRIQIHCSACTHCHVDCSDGGDSHLFLEQAIQRFSQGLDNHSGLGSCTHPARHSWGKNPRRFLDKSVRAARRRKEAAPGGQLFRSYMSWSASPDPAIHKHSALLVQNCEWSTEEHEGDWGHRCDIPKEVTWCLHLQGRVRSTKHLMHQLSVMVGLFCASSVSVMRCILRAHVRTITKVSACILKHVRVQARVQAQLWSCSAGRAYKLPQIICTSQGNGTYA